MLNSPIFQVGGSPYTINHDLTINGSLTITGNLNFGDASTDILTITGYMQGPATPGPLRVGNVASSQGLVAQSDLLIGGKLEVDGLIYADAGIAVFAGTLHVNDNIPLSLGNTPIAPDAVLAWNTTQTTDALFLGVSGSRNLVIADNANSVFDFAHGNSTDATIFLHSRNQNTTQWLSLTHNGTDAIISTGLGDILFTVAGGNIAPSANDGAALGISGQAFSDLFLAVGGVINFGAGDVLISHADNQLSIGGALFHNISQASGTTGLPVAMTITGGTHTGLTAATECIGVNFNFSATKTWAAGAGPLATQREVVIQAPTYVGNAGGALTMTDAYSFYITGAPTAGANMTITRAWAAGFNGNIGVGAGTVSLPSFSFLGDPNTGLYWISDGQLGFASNGVRTALLSGLGFDTDRVTSVNTGNSFSIAGRVADGGTSIKVGSITTLTSGKIVSFYNDAWTTEKAFIDKDGGYSQVRGVVQTTDATITTVATFTLAATSKVFHVKGIVVGRTTSDANRASYELDVTVYRAGAGAVIQGAITSVHTVESDATWNATFDVTGNDLRLRVTGVAATTINWSGVMTYVIVE